MSSALPTGVFFLPFLVGVEGLVFSSLTDDSVTTKKREFKKLTVFGSILI